MVLVSRQWDAHGAHPLDLSCNEYNPRTETGNATQVECSLSAVTAAGMRGEFAGTRERKPAKTFLAYHRKSLVNQFFLPVRIRTDDAKTLMLVDFENCLAEPVGESVFKQWVVLHYSGHQLS